MNEKLYSAPLFTVDEDRHQLWKSFATATFANVCDLFFIVIPYHAAETLNGRAMQLALGKELINLAGKSILTKKSLDLAVIQLTAQEVDKIFETMNFVTLDTLSPYELHGTKCVIQGFPANRNRMKARNKPLNTEGLQIFADECTSGYKSDDKSFHLTNIALAYDERNVIDNDGAHVNKRQLAGMSGSIVMQVLKSANSVGGLPVGIFVAQDNIQRALVCIRYSVILECIRANLDRFGGRRS